MCGGGGRGGRGADNESEEEEEVEGEVVDKEYCMGSRMRFCTLSVTTGGHGELVHL